MLFGIVNVLCDNELVAIEKECKLTRAILALLLLCSSQAFGQSPTVATGQANVWANPLQPPIIAGPLQVSNGHVTVAGQRVCIPGVNVTNYTVMDIITGRSNVAQGLDPNKQALAAKHFRNIKQMGFGLIRIHGLDCYHGLNAFCACNGRPVGAAQTSTSLDPWSLKALAWTIDQCRQNDLRVCLTVHYNRVIYPSDVATLYPTGNAPPEFAECLSYAFDVKTGVGGIWPWKVYSPALQAVDALYEQQLLSYVSPYDAQGRTIGQLVDLLVIENEHLIGKQLPYGGWTGIPQVPVLQALHQAAWLAWCQQQGLDPTKATNVQKAQFCSYLDVQMAQKAIARLRPLTSALLISGTYFGNAQWPAVPGCQLGDLSDFHVYSGNAPTDLDGFCNGQTPADNRTRCSAVAAGCSRAGMPQCCSEWGPQRQNSGGVIDSPSELMTDLANAYNAFIAQDVDIAILYAYSNGPFAADGSTLATGCYDLRDRRVSQAFLNGVQAQNARFSDTSLRTSPVVTFSPNWWGSMSANGKSYTGPDGPYTSTGGLYAIPAGTKVMVQP